MAWQAVSTQLILHDGSRSLGLLVGTGAEMGYFAFFMPGEIDGGNWVVSDAVAPTVVIQDQAYNITAYQYAGHPVWESANAAGFVFWSPTNSSWIVMSELREPSWIEPIAVADVVHGDSFWMFSMPSVNGGAGTARAGGAATGSKTVSVVWRLWVPYDVHTSADNEEPCGVYYNANAQGTENDPLFHTIGFPNFETYGTTPDIFSGETFIRAPEQDASGNDVFVGSNGHDIRYDTLYHVWRTGSFSDEPGTVFWQSSTKPIMKHGGTAARARTTFTPMKILEGGDTEQASGERNLVIRLRNLVFGKFRVEQYIAEVEVWR